MEIELNKVQSKKADLLLKNLCDSDAVFDREEADKIFISKSESDFVCLALEKKGLIDIIGQTENDALYRFTKTDTTCGFLNNGGLSQERRKSKKLDWYKVIPIIVSLIALYLGYLNYSLKQNEKTLDVKVYELDNENIFLKSQVDSLNFELNRWKNIALENEKKVKSPN